MTVINIKTYRVLKEQTKQEQTYRHGLSKLGKAELLQELLNYHESFQRSPHDMRITLRGQYLMEVLEARAELSELKDLSREFQHKLKTRLYAQMQAMGSES